MVERIPPTNAFLPDNTRENRNLIPEFWMKWDRLSPIQREVLIKLWGIRQRWLDLEITEASEQERLISEITNGIDVRLLKSQDFTDVYRLGRPEYSTTSLKKMQAQSEN